MRRFSAGWTSGWGSASQALRGLEREAEVERGAGARLEMLAGVRVVASGGRPGAEQEVGVPQPQEVSVARGADHVLVAAAAVEGGGQRRKHAVVHVPPRGRVLVGEDRPHALGGGARLAGEQQPGRGIQPVHGGRGGFFGQRLVVPGGGLGVATLLDHPFEPDHRDLRLRAGGSGQQRVELRVEPLRAQQLRAAPPGHQPLVGRGVAVGGALLEQRVRGRPLPAGQREQPSGVPQGLVVGMRAGHGREASGRRFEVAGPDRRDRIEVGRARIVRGILQRLRQRRDRLRVALERHEVV